MKNALLLLSLLFCLTLKAQDYQKEWEKVMEYEALGLTKSAAEATDVIYKLAKKDKNEPQLLKTFFFRSKYMQTLEEDAQVKIINSLKDEMKTASAPTRAFMESIYAGILNDIYTYNRYKIDSRSTISNSSTGNFLTWSGDNFKAEIVSAYLRSITKRDMLYAVPLTRYEAIINFSPALLKTNRSVYDFLVENYLSFLQTDTEFKTWNITPDSVAALYGDTNTFIKATVPESTSKNFRICLTLCQDLERFYLEQNDQYSLQRSVIRRLDYLSEKDNSTGSDEAQMATLQKLSVSWGDSPFAYMAKLNLANLYYSNASKEAHPDYLAKAKSLCSDILAATEKHAIAAPAKNLQNLIITKKVSLQAENYIMPDAPALAKVTFKNTDTLELRIYKIKHMNSNQYYRNYDISETIKESLKHRKPLLIKKYTLPHKDNHFEYNTEIILPSLPKGTYIIAATPVNADTLSSPAYIKVQATELALTTINNRESSFRLVNRATGAPVKGVKATVNSQNYISNSSGEISVISKDTKYENRNIVFTHQGDTISDSFFNYNHNYGKEKQPPQATVQFYTDRAIYRPGQTMFFKGILTQTDEIKYSVVPNVYITVILNNPSYKEIGKLRLKTNEYGSFTGEFVLPQNITGEFSIETEEDEDMENDPAYNEKKDEHPFWDNIDFERSDAHFRVEEYKRPTFEISFTPVKEAVKLNQELTVKGKAISYSKAPIAGASVKYRVRKSTYYQHNYWENDYYDSYNNNEFGEIIDNDETTTDANGNFEITFTTETKDVKNNYATYNYTIYADVTDVSGETRTSTFTVRAAANPLSLTLSVPQTIETDSKTEITFNSENTNGQFIPAQGEMAIYKLAAPNRLLAARPWGAPELQTILEAEFIKNFPHLPYSNEADTIIHQKRVLLEKINTKEKKTLTLSDFTGWESGRYEVVFTAQDSLGNSHEVKKIFNLEHQQDAKLADNGIYAFRIINTNFIKEGYAECEIKTSLPVLYGNISAYVNNGLHYNKPIVIKNGKAIVRVPIVKNAYTVMVINFSFVWQNSLHTQSQHASTVKYPDPVIIETSTLNSKLLPGSEQKWSVTIKNGKNKEAEMLASMYDASLDMFVKRGWNNLNTYSYRYESPAHTYLKTHGNQMGYFNSVQTNPYPLINSFDTFYNYGFKITGSWNHSNYDIKTQVPAKDDMTISGIVTDENNQPLPGVNVVIKGTHEGTQTDLEGKYTIYVAKGESIEISYIGFTNQVVTPKDTSFLTIPIRSDDTLLESVVVEAYRTTSTKKSNIAATTVTSQAIQIRGAASISQTLQGQVPGLSITTGSADPGYYSLGGGEDKFAVGINMTIDGSHVIDGKLNPIIIIDGITLSEGQKNSVNESDILSVTTLKPGEESAAYGDEGKKRGVVIITTKKSLESLKEVKARKNFNETAFFYPQLTTDKNGNISFTFTTPEALTEWKLRLLAHNKKAQSGYLEKTFFTQKDLMITPNMPRFLREKDVVIITAKVTNLTAEPKTGNAMLQLFDAATMQPADVQLQNTETVQPFTLAANSTATVSWKITVPLGMQGVQYKVLAKAGDFTDGEENILPVLSNRMLVTESLPVWVRPNTTKEYTFENLKNNGSSTLINHGITLEYTSNPAWTALQSLPYLMEFEHECSEQVFSRYYANSIAAHIIKRNPKISELFATWRAAGKPASKLEQNEQLKSIILAETPWMLDNQTEAEKKNRLALLMDFDKMQTALAANLDKLDKKQADNGGFPWFEGGQENEYITRHVLAGFGHLKQLGMSPTDSTKINGITKIATAFIDGKFLESYHKQKEYIKKNKRVGSTYPYNDLHYLYTRSFFLKQSPLNDTLTKVVKYYLANAKTNWLNYSLYEKAMAALVLHRFDEKETAQKIVKSLKETSSNNEEWGMYWIENKPNWYWYRAPIETQAMIIEAFAEVANDVQSVDAMKVWLLKNKQNKSWPTTKSTTEAVYALLMQGTDWLSVKDNTIIKLGDEKVLTKKMAENEKEAGTGYVKLEWSGKEVTKDMATLTVENKSAVPGYGGFYWQYFEDLDKIQPAQEGLMDIAKELYLKNQAENKLERITEANALQIGNLVTVRLVLSVKEDMEYVHLKDLRAAAFEPVDILSGYEHKDGLGYYRSTRDVATHFFFDRIPKGTYVLEYDVRVNNAGEFSNGISTLQSMYAPEFSGHSKGFRVKTQ